MGHRRKPRDDIPFRGSPQVALFVTKGNFKAFGKQNCLLSKLYGAF
jgi:hypothetical protein